jgi:molybdopterin/thiamine biosynthesis adenylyltransferase
VPQINVFVIGVGGVGSWTAEKLAKMAFVDLTLIDGDKLEEKNLDRQLFGPEDIGKNKAKAFADKIAKNNRFVVFIPEYFQAGLLEFKSSDILLCCADNHSCRREVLAACDQFKCRAIIGANEFTDAEAYWYEPSYRGTPNDPRIIYPNILSDVANDPLRPEGCTGNVTLANPQLILANDWASGLMLHLFWFHTQKRQDLPSDIKQNWPVHHQINVFKTETIRYGDRIKNVVVQS